MEAAELKTPLRPPKRYKLGKKRSDNLKMMEFISFGSSDYFSHLDQPDQDEVEIDSIAEGRSRDQKQTYKRVDEWLQLRGVYKAAACQKKELFYEERRERVNSISYFDHGAESDLTDFSPNNKSLTPMSLRLSPHNSKICQKRSNFTSLSNLEIKSATKLETRIRDQDFGRASEHKPTHHPIREGEEEESPVTICKDDPETVRRQTAISY